MFKPTNLNEFLEQKFTIIEKYKSELNGKPKYYAGIGSRNTPADIQALEKAIAMKLKEKGFILRSGGAKGSDLAFESGVKEKQLKEIYYAKDSAKNTLSYDIAKHFHPKPFFLTYKEEDLESMDYGKQQTAEKRKYTLQLMARNTFQVMGLDLNSPVNFVICYTEDGCEDHNNRTQKTGGTGQAISIASHFGIPVYNLANKPTVDYLKDWLGVK